MRETSTCPLPRPRSVKAAVERLARAEGIGLNQFVATAVADKLAAMNTVAFFKERKARADQAACRALLNRGGRGSTAGGGTSAEVVADACH